MNIIELHNRLIKRANAVEQAYAKGTIGFAPKTFDNLNANEESLKTWLKRMKDPRWEFGGSLQKHMLNNAAYEKAQSVRDDMRKIDGSKNWFNRFYNDTKSALGGNKYKGIGNVAYKELLTKDAAKFLELINSQYGSSLPTKTSINLLENMLHTPGTFGLSSKQLKDIAKLREFELAASQGGNIDLLNKLRSATGKMNAEYLKKHNKLLSASKQRGIRNLKNIGKGTALTAALAAGGYALS